jgi:hypothetical protein
MLMSPAELRNQLETVARKLDIRVRFESFEPGAFRRGGLCKVRGETCIVIDAGAPMVEQVATLEGALRKLNLEAIFIPPFVRARIEGKETTLGPSLRKARRPR